MRKISILIVFILFSINIKAKATMPVYDESFRISDSEIKNYQKALLIEVNRLGLNRCSSEVNRSAFSWALKSFLENSSDKVKWYLLDSDSPLIVAIYQYRDLNSDYGKVDVHFNFYTVNNQYLERVEVKEYFTTKSKVNEGSLSAPKIVEKLVTRESNALKCD